MSQERASLVKVMSGMDLLGLSFGAMIGWSWVVLANQWISRGGALGAIVAFLLGAVMCIAVSLVYAELTSAMPVAGGPVAFAYKSLGETWAWVAGWTMSLAYISVAAWESVAISAALDYIIPIPELLRLWTVAGEDVYLGSCIAGAVVAATITTVNYKGTRISASAQNWGTILLVLAWMAFILTACFRGSSANMFPLWTSAEGTASVLMMVPFMMVGFDVIPQSAEEANIPHRKIGYLLLISVIAATCWYIAIVLGLSYAIPEGYRQSSRLAVCYAMEVMTGSPVAGKILALGGVCGILTSWNAFLLAASRVLFAMSRAKMLPPVFSKVHPTSGTPVNALLSVGLLCVAAPFLGANTLMWLANVGSLGTCVTYFIVSVAFVRLRRREPLMERPFKAGSSIFVGILSVAITTVFVSLYLPIGPSSLVWPHECLIVIVWVIAGVVFYSLSKRSHGAVSPKERAYLILGTEGNPDSSERLMPARNDC